jgi:hypothetical protein
MPRERLLSAPASALDAELARGVDVGDRTPHAREGR